MQLGLLVYLIDLQQPNNLFSVGLRPLCSGDLRRIVLSAVASSYIPKPTELNEKTLHSKTNTSNEPDMIMYLVKIPLNLVILD